jgi:hypothetical protein
VRDDCSSSARIASAAAAGYATGLIPSADVTARAASGGPGRCASTAPANPAVPTPLQSSDRAGATRSWLPTSRRAPPPLESGAELTATLLALARALHADES